MNRRVTVRDIAAKAGVHFTTVSMALRNHPRISVETRQRIKALAKAMGYHPDAMLNALSSYRKRQRRPQFQASIAWINAFPNRDDLFRISMFREFFDGASRRAEEMGFKLEEFWLGEQGLTRSRLRAIFNSRSIRGALIAPLGPNRENSKIELMPWDHLAAVSLSLNFAHPKLDTVVASYYHCMQTALRELRKLGYRRIGFLMDRDLDLRCDCNWQAAFWVDYHSHPAEWRLAPLWVSPGPVNEGVFSRWLKKERPEVIVPCSGPVAELVRKMGLSVPKDIGLASHQVDKSDKVFSGMDQRGAEVGATALEYLVDLLNKQAYGVPKIPRQIFIEGRWVRGKTVRKVGPSLSSRAGKAE